ncbi:unnamed protein product [Echinostoma caproni]|uniref:FXYD domain-containing ion transport regulator n=1 Tax=Echinostoma caproni TaxID=27848 RepID=A0A183ADI6_9TREM|nr:unnamed protein product [Echinostoma caproni]
MREVRCPKQAREYDLYYITHKKDEPRIAGAIIGVLAFSFGFLFMLVFVPWGRCRKNCSRTNRDNTSAVENQRSPPPYYTLISELLTIPSANSPTLPTYEQCTQQTLPPSFEETIASDLEEAAPPYTPPETGTPTSEELPQPSQSQVTPPSSQTPQQEAPQPCLDMCLHCSLPESPSNGLPPPYV